MKNSVIGCIVLVLVVGLISSASAAPKGVPKSTLAGMGFGADNVMSDEDGLAVRGKGWSGGRNGGDWWGKKGDGWNGGDWWGRKGDGWNGGDWWGKKGDGRNGGGHGDWWGKTGDRNGGDWWGKKGDGWNGGGWWDKKGGGWPNGNHVNGGNHVIKHCFTPNGNGKVQ